MKEEIVSKRYGELRAWLYLSFWSNEEKGVWGVQKIVDALHDEKLGNGDILKMMESANVKETHPEFWDVVRKTLSWTARLSYRGWRDRKSTRTGETEWFGALPAIDGFLAVVTQPREAGGQAEVAPHHWTTDPDAPWRPCPDRFKVEIHRGVSVIYSADLPAGLWPHQARAVAREHASQLFASLKNEVGAWPS